MILLAKIPEKGAAQAASEPRCKVVKVRAQVLFMPFAANMLFLHGNQIAGGKR
ncbi:hypothetical protein ACFFGQ_00310 [Rufibacter quisquiliarum]